MKSVTRIGITDIASIQMYDERKGKIEPIFPCLKALVELYKRCLNTSIEFKKPKKGQYGIWTETGYKDGIFEMLQNEEIDVCFSPQPYTMKDPPGSFTFPVMDEEYFILSYPSRDAKIVHSVTSSFTEISLQFLLLTILLISWLSKLMSWLQMKPVDNQILTNIFDQILSKKSLYNLVKIVSITLFVVLFNANFNTSAVVNSEIRKIDTLKDVIDHRLKPVFMESESAFEIFEHETSLETKKVFELAKAAGTDTPLTVGIASDFNLVELNDESVAFIASSKLEKISQVMLFNMQSSFRIHYKSGQPFHRTIVALLYNQNFNKKNLLELMVTHTTEAGISQFIYSQIPYDILLTSAFFDVTPYSIMKILNDKSDNTNSFLAWSVQSFTEIFSIYLIILVCTVICCISEIMVHRIHFK